MRTSSRNTLMIYESKLRKVHMTFASNKKDDPMALSPAGLNLTD